jgi:hypothetical protein
MDKYNLFYTPTTYKLVRVDWAIILVVLSGLVLYHWREVHWWRFVFAFLLSDLVGTFPGLYVYYARRAGEHRSIPLIYHQLYNAGHSFLGIALVTLVWFGMTGVWEWAMLALPIHLAGDRAVFGNIYKPYGTAFEPVPVEAFQRFLREYQAHGRW